MRRRCQGLGIRARGLIGFLGVIATLGPTPARGSVLDSLLVTAMRQNPRLVALDAGWRAARERIPQAAPFPDPMLEWQADAAPLSRLSPAQAATQKIGLSQMLMFPGKRGAMRGAMAAEAEMAHSQLERGRLEVAADLHRAYYDLYALYESTDILEQDRDALRSMAEIARAKYEVGTVMQQDLLKANVELAMDMNRLRSMRVRIPAAVAKINAILDRPANAPLARPDLGDTSAVWMDPDTLERLALERQPMLQMKDQAISKGESDRRLAGKAGWPDLTVGVEYMAERGMSDAVTWMAGVNLPIWSMGSVKAGQREADASLVAARADRTQTKNETTSMVRDAYAMATSMRSEVALYRDAVLPQAGLALGSARAAYETSGADFMSYLDAQRTVLQARLMYVEALTELMKSRAEVGLAVGDPALLGVSDE
jgi:outer membrane protein, heavy metal efflux system